MGHHKNYGKMLSQTRDAQNGTSRRTEIGEVFIVYGARIMGKNGRL